MKTLKHILEGILSSVEADVDAGVNAEKVYSYLKRPELVEWGEFMSEVSDWASKFGKIGRSHRNRKLCGSQPVAYICYSIEKVVDDHFRLGVKDGDQIIVLFLTEAKGALIFAKDKQGKTQRKVVPAYSSLTIMNEVSDSKSRANIADMPFGDVYYRVRDNQVDEYNIPKSELSKIK